MQMKRFVGVLALGLLVTSGRLQAMQAQKPEESNSGVIIGATVVGAAAVGGGIWAYKHYRRLEQQRADEQQHANQANDVLAVNTLVARILPLHNCIHNEAFNDADFSNLTEAQQQLLGRAIADFFAGSVDRDYDAFPYAEFSTYLREQIKIFGAMQVAYATNNQPLPAGLAELVSDLIALRKFARSQEGFIQEARDYSTSRLNGRKQDVEERKAAVEEGKLALERDKASPDTNWGVFKKNFVTGTATGLATRFVTVLAE